MFNNIGRKIKTLAVVICCLNILALFISGFYCVGNGAEIDSDGLVIFGLILMVAGPIVGWLASCLLYGYGELIDKTQETAQNTRQLLRFCGHNADGNGKSGEENTPLQEAPQAAPGHTCAYCGSNLSDDARFCPMCGFEKAVRKTVCPACGAEPGDNAVFCPMCGRRLNEQ